MDIRERKGSTHYVFCGDKIETIDVSKTNASNNYLLASLNIKVFLNEAPQGSDKILGGDVNFDLVIINSFSGLIDIKIPWGDDWIDDEPSK